MWFKYIDIQLKILEDKTKCCDYFENRQKVIIVNCEDTSMIKILRNAKMARFRIGVMKWECRLIVHSAMTWEKLLLCKRCWGTVCLFFLMLSDFVF